jgi:DNA modification methylase
MKSSLLRTTRSKPFLGFEYVPVACLRDNPNNAREHDRKQLAKLARSIRKFGFVIPILIDENGELLCGHARVAAARQLNLTTVPAIRASSLSEADKRGIMLADNRLAELGSWNGDALKRELRFFSELGIDFDFESIGFDTAQVDFLLDGAGEPDDVAEIPSQLLDTATVSAPGDLWQLDEHRVCCGNALETWPYEALLINDRAQMAFTDPPYNVRIDGHAGGLGSVKHREFAMASGEMTEAQFTIFLRGALQQMTRFSADGSIVFVCMDWRHTSTLLHASGGMSLRNICVWVKNNGGMGSLYRSQHEFVFVFKSGAADHINNVELGKYGRNRTNVWEYRGINSFGRDRDDLLKLHPTVKPVALVADAIKDCSNRGDIILDPFGGSGTTVIAAEKTARRAAVIEIDPRYVDATIRRWQAYTGKSAICTTTGQSFAERESSNPSL